MQSRLMQSALMHWRPATMLVALAVAGCAGRSPQPDEPVDRASLVGQRLLPGAADGGGAGAVEPYRLAPSQAYRMPQAHHAPPPEVPTTLLAQTLPATTVCLQVVVSAQGVVERAEPLTGRADCASGAAPTDVLLSAAASEAVLQWAYRPAAVCYYPAGMAAPAAGDCSGAERFEDVAVTLQYAFTFEVVEGQARVRQGRAD